MAMLSTVNLFVRDLETIVAFYSGLFGFPEKTAQRSAIYRALDAGGVTIGINAFDAYRLLGLEQPAGPTQAHIMLTFDIESTAAIDVLSEAAKAAGATLVKPAYDTAYGSRQSVLMDPEGHVFRINAFFKAGADPL